MVGVLGITCEEEATQAINKISLAGLSSTTKKNNFRSSKSTPPASPVSRSTPLKDPNKHEATVPTQSYPHTYPTTTMKIANALSLVLALGHRASAYVVRVYTEPDCKGESQEVNVWANTCRDSDLIDIRSVELLKYGRWRQRAHVYGEHASLAKCLFGLEVETFWVDGGSTKVGDCKSYDEPIKALASFHQA